MTFETRHPAEHEEDAGSKWIVNSKRSRVGGEICVIRESNTFGQRSWGWFGTNKILIISECHWLILDSVWEELLVLAQKIANDLNDKERDKCSTRH